MENEIQQIHERNKRVELDKAWETSFTRRAIIAFLTYTFASVFLVRIGNDSPFMNAIVPVAGYLFSTMSLPFIKDWWVSRK